MQVERVKHFSDLDSEPELEPGCKEQEVSLNPKSEIKNPKSETRNQNPKSETRNQKPETRNQQP